MKKRFTRPTLAERRRKAREAAMPEVKKLVRKHGRSTISACLQQLRDYEKKLRQLETARSEVAALESQL
jgi:hypothetical protein